MTRYQGNGAVKLAAELAARIGDRSVTVRQAGRAESFSELPVGQLWIVPADSAQVLAASQPSGGRGADDGPRSATA